jgi:hypothetical protein
VWFLRRNGDKMEKGFIDKNTNIEENFFGQPKKVVDLKNIVRLPPNKNGILIMFNDDLSNPTVNMTEHLWGILKAMEDQEFLFTKELNGDKLSIHIYMERST